MGRLMKSEEASQMSGTPDGGCGSVLNSTPWIVSLEVKCR